MQTLVFHLLRLLPSCFCLFIWVFLDWSLALANLYIFLSVVCVLHLYDVTNCMHTFMNCASSVYLGRIGYLFVMIINVCPLVSILPETII